ncbi:recombination mediator RecR [Sandarakinorhabdus rubra]|uniref:recombination mediator RecR n=1 Tax=Sandarakinorhabdus rubra TaxID=2672568 RepID=UPI0013D9C76A|nr:recombination mediator RecR [Sandarakinorhabdus rubra]
MASPEIDALTRALSRLPGLGPRSARRAVLHLIRKRETALEPLLAALQTVAARLMVCGTCGNVETSDPCAICRDPRRDPTLLCVVADVADLWALDGRHLFSGRFHVLGGRLSALDGIGPDDLAIPALVARASDGVVKEVVLALSATMEGQATMHYVADALAPTGVRVSQLAQGLPMGGELDYLDEGTLALALNARKPL